MRPFCLSSAPLQAAVRRPRVTSTQQLSIVCRRYSVAGGGRGDIYQRHAAQSRSMYAGAARGIVHTSESTQPQDGQLHIRKRHRHIDYDRMYSGGAHHRPAIASWAYLMPSLRENVEGACPAALYDKLRAGESALTGQEERQLVDAQHLLRFELQQRIGLLEDSLAEAELAYLVQWPSLFQRAWLRLPLPAPRQGHAGEVAGEPSAITVTSAAATAPLQLTAWLSAPSTLPDTHRAAAAAAASPRHSAFESRLTLLTRHVVECVEEELRTADAALQKGNAQRSRRQAALEAAWRAQWQAAMQWHAGGEVN